MGLITGSSRDSHREFRDRIHTLQSSSRTPTETDSDVLVFPAFQQEAVNLTTDYALFKECLDIASRFDKVDLYLTSGYVNFPKEIAEKLAHYRSTMRFLFAAPQANSFFHDPGFASVIPALYNLVGESGGYNG